MRFKDGSTEFGWRVIGVAIAEPSNCITFQFVKSSHRVLVNVQLCVVYSRWHRPRLGPNAAIGFVKTIDGRMRFESLLVIARQ